MMHGKRYDDLKEYVENITGVFVPEDASSRKLKISNTIIAMTKAALKSHQSEYDSFMSTIAKAKSLTQKKRYYYSNYGFSNFKDVVLGKTDKLVPDKENHDKFYMENIVEWWKKKACSRFTTLQTENRLRTEIEVWTGDKEIDIIR
jgi:ribosome biogenesis GTPase A